MQSITAMDYNVDRKCRYIHRNRTNMSKSSSQAIINQKQSISIQFQFFSHPQAADLSKPIDKKLYKGTNPSCHDFNQTTATCEGAPLLVGFTTGQIQLVYPGRREQGKLYNEEVSFICT